MCPWRLTENCLKMPSVDTVLLHLKRRETPDLERSELSAFDGFVSHCMRYGICGKGGLLTRRQMATALKLARLPPAHEDGVTLYIQWLCLFRCYRRIHGAGKA